MRNMLDKAYDITRKISDVLLGEKDDTINSEHYKNDNIKAIVEELSDPIKVTESLSLMNNAYNNRNKAALFNKIDNYERKNKLRIKLIKALTAAAALAIAFTVYYTTDKNEARTHFIADVTEPVDGYSKPVIVEEGDDKHVEELIINKKVDYSIKENNNKVETKQLKIIVPTGFMQSVVLPDGTEVIINSQSVLKFPSEFIGESRDVELTGEAYFKVKKSDKPFNVKINSVDIKVYGTEFNINEFNGEVTTVLVEGEVGVNMGSREVIMKPNQLFTSKPAGDYKIEEVNIKSHLGWMNNEFDYRESQLCDVLRDISRWYDIDITLSSDINKNMKVSLYSRRGVDKKDVFKLLELSNDIIFINEGGGKYKIEKKN